MRADAAFVGVRSPRLAARIATALALGGRALLASVLVAVGAVLCLPEVRTWS